MECHNTNSSPYTISLDFEEDIESEGHQTYSSLGLHIVNCGEKVKRKKHRHNESKCEHRQRNKNRRKENTDSVRTKFVTQEIHVERQDFKCIINMNTTVCQHKNSHHISCNEKSSDNSTSNNNKDRIVPLCLRQTCCKSRHHKTRLHRHSQAHCKTGLHHGTRDLNRTYKCLGQSKHVHNKSKWATHEKKATKEKLPRKEIEKKLLLPKNQLELDYEDISIKSLENYLEIPTSYKYIVKPCKKDYHQSKLDTLIKRTKERERKLVEQSRTTNPWYRSTLYREVSSAEFPMACSEIDASLASRSTLIIEPWYHGHSATIGLGLYPTKTESDNSPTSPIEDYWLKIPENNYELQIKSEPRMDIEVYSPTQSPD